MTKRSVLRHILSRGRSADHQMLTEALQVKRQPAPKAAPSTKATLEVEARQIRLDPASANGGHANHKQLVDCMAEIYAQLNAGEK